MSQAESYEPHGKHKVLSPCTNLAKDGKRNRRGTTGVSEIEAKGTIGVRDKEKREKVTGQQMIAAEAANTTKDGKWNRLEKNGIREIEAKKTLGVIDTEKRGKVSGLQEIAAKAAHRKAEKQLVGSLIRQWPVGDIEPQVSKQMADLTAAQVTPTIVNVVHERPIPLVDLPMRSKARPHGKTVDLNWICITCNRMMLKTQQQDHLAGKEHIAPTIVKEKSLLATNVTIVRSKKAKAKPIT